MFILTISYENESRCPGRRCWGGDVDPGDIDSHSVTDGAVGGGRNIGGSGGAGSICSICDVSDINSIGCNSHVGNRTGGAINIDSNDNGDGQ